MCCVGVCLGKNSFTKIIWIKVIRRKTWKRLQKWIKNCKDLGLFYLSTGILIFSVHVFKLQLAVVTIRNLHSKNNMTARHPCRYLQVDVSEKVVTQYDYCLITRCWWKRLLSQGNIGRKYFVESFFVSSNEHSCCSHKVSLSHTGHSSGSSTEV